jgi:integrase/recombinase XerD
VSSSGSCLTFSVATSKAVPQTSRNYRCCKCPIHVERSLAGEGIRKALDLTSWEAAHDLVRRWECQGRIQLVKIEVTINDAVRKFLEDAKARRLSEATLQKYIVVLEKQLVPFCRKKGLRYPGELSLQEVREFRQTWKDGAISGLKKLERLRAFFGFCKQSDWMKNNPATLIRPPRVSQKPTLPFSQDEFKRTLSACDHYGDNYGRLGQGNAVRLKALTLLLRYSGLRIRDAVCLPRKKLQGHRLLLYTQKTGVPVFVPLPEFVTERFIRLT